MTNFTRSWLLMKHTSASVFMAFEVLIQDYSGGEIEFYKDIERSKSGALLVVRGTYKRHFYGLVVLNLNATGTVTYDAQAYTKGTPANLITCYGITDLQVKSFEDSAFWNAEIISIYAPRVVFEPTGEVRITPFEMAEK